VATGGGRIIPTLDELTARRGSRLEAAVERARYFEHIRPPAIGEAPPVEQMATLDPGPDVAGDDLLDRSTEVKVLFLGGFGFPSPPVVLQRPHPNIEGLIAWREMTPEAMAMLPNLRFLQLATQSASPELQAAFPSSLEEIWANGLDLTALSKLARLRYLRTNLRSGGAAQSHALAGLSELRGLHLEVFGALRGVRALGRLRQLEDFSVNSVSSIDFKTFSDCRRLKHLGLGALGSTKTLDGIEELETLEGLSLGGRRCPPISPIAHLPRLQNLSIASIQAPPILDVVGKMVQLRAFALQTGSPYTLKSAALFSELEQLESLQCLAHLEDKDLTPLARLKRLKYLCFYGTFPEDAVRWLQDQLPECKIDLTTGTPPAAVPEIKVGLLTAAQEEDGTWSVWQDLRVVLECDDNHAAEDGVRAEMERTNPEALRRIEFDSENDGFAAYVTSRDDLEALAAAIGALAKKTA
jgi:hypothetical protein